MTPCPCRTRLLDFHCNTLPPNEHAALHHHLAICPACARDLADLDRETLSPPAPVADACAGEQSPTFRLRGEPGPRMPAKQPPSSHNRLLHLHAAPPTPRTNPLVGDYEILEVLGRGGMGVVFKAQQRSLGRLVALKMIQTAADADVESRHRFRAEAEALARLQHPNIVQIYEVGEQDGVPFFSLEYVEGGNLKEQLADRPQSPALAAQLVRTLALAMHYAHERGIVHRDLKPANILMVAGGGWTVEGKDTPSFSPATRHPPPATLFPKISDFGLAKQLTEAVQLTRSGDVLGTPNYMAPEQTISNSRIGPTTDLYALGAILYEILTGRPPFLGGSALETFQEIVHSEPIPPSRLQPGVPRDLETICLKCLHKEPHQRYASGQDLAADLGRFLEGQPITARRISPVERMAKWARRRPAVAALLAALVCVTLIGVAFVLLGWQEAVAARREALNAKHDAEGAKVEAEARAEQALQAKQASLRASAKLAAHRGQGLCEQGEIAAGLLWLARSLEIAESAAATDLEPGIRQNIARWQQWQFAPGTVSPQQGTPILAVAFSPDGQTLATGAWWCKWDHAGVPAEVQLWKRGASWEKIGPPMLHPHPVKALAYSPDGKALLSTSLDGKARLWEVATGKLRLEPIAHRGKVHVAAFSRDGRMAMTGGSVWSDTPQGKKLTGGELRFWDTTTGKLLGEPLELDSAITSAAFSPDGQHVLVGCIDQTARWLSYPAQTQVGEVLRHPGPVWAVAVSPDGKRLLVGGSDGTARLYDVDSRKQVAKTLQHEAPLTSAVFSPDGHFILTGSGSLSNDGAGSLWNRLGEVRLWDALSGKQVGSTLEHPMKVHGVAFSADGRWFASGSEDGRARLWSMLPATINPVVLRHREVPEQPKFSPDGKRLLALAGQRVHCWDVATGQQPFAALTHKAAIRDFAYSPDGKSIVTISDDHTACLWDAATGQLRFAPLQHAGKVIGTAFSPDGRMVATVGYPETVRRWEVATGKEIGQALTHDKRPLLALAFSPDSRLLVTGGSAGHARVWEAATGKPVGSSWCQGDWWVVSVTFLPDNKTVLVGQHNYHSPGHSCLWDVTTGKTVGVPMADAGGRGICSPNGRFFLAQNLFRSFARLGDTATGKPIGPPLAHRHRVWAGAISPDSRLVLTGSHDHTAQLWDAATGQPIGWALNHAGAVEGVAFHPSGQLLATTGQDQVIRLWQLPAPVTGTTEQVRRQVEALTGQALDEHGALRQMTR